MSRILLLAAAAALGVAEPDETWVTVPELRSRIAEAPTLPPLADTARFPPAEWLQQRRTMWNHLQTRAERAAETRLHRAEECYAMSKLCQRNAYVLLLLCDANRDYMRVYARRCALREARDILGAEAYEKGWYP